MISNEILVKTKSTILTSFLLLLVFCFHSSNCYFQIPIVRKPLLRLHENSRVHELGILEKQREILGLQSAKNPIPDGLGKNPKPPSLATRFSSKDWLHCLQGWPNSLILSRILPNMLSIVSWTILLILFFDVTKLKCNFPFFIHSLVGSVLSLLIVFKTNTSYDRFWEGRKQWGAIMSACRSIARLVFVYLNKANFNVICKLLVIFCISLRQHLRGEKILEDYMPHLMNEDILEVFSKKNRPLFLLRSIETELVTLIDDKYGKTKPNLSSALSVDITGLIRALDSAMGACDRIVRTPAPYFYSINTSRLLSLYLFSLPLTLIPLLKWYTVPTILAVSWCFIAVQEIGHFIEDPFNSDIEVIPMREMTNNLLDNLRELFDMTDVTTGSVATALSNDSKQIF